MKIMIGVSAILGLAFVLAGCKPASSPESEGPASGRSSPRRDRLDGISSTPADLPKPSHSQVALRAKVVGISGQATSTLKESDPVPVELGMDLPVGTHVITREEASVDLLIPDLAQVIRLYPDSTLGIRNIEMAIEAVGRSQSTELDLIQGQVLCLVPELTPGSEFQVWIPGLVAAVWQKGQFLISHEGAISVGPDSEPLMVVEVSVPATEIPPVHPQHTLMAGSRQPGPTPPEVARGLAAQLKELADLASGSDEGH